jgi:hypothetical protein
MVSEVSFHGCFGYEGRLNIMIESVWSEALYLMVARVEKERDRERERENGNKMYTLKACSQ